MKIWTWAVLLLIIDCQNQKQNNANPDNQTQTKPTVSANSKTDDCWIGTINGKTPVLIHYRLDSDIVVGEIIYLNTKDKLPIKLLGTIEKDKTFRLLEFERSGNITGIISGNPTDNSFSGTWFSPKSRKELALSLVKKDTTILSAPISIEVKDLFGSYHYQYSEAGHQGDLDIKRLTDSTIVFGITSVTGEPARNVAQVDNDTIKLKSTRFTYKLPDTDDCEFQLTFYKNFVRIKYTTGTCEGQFGNNATVEGIFLKTK